MLKFPIFDNILIVNILKFQTYFFCEMEEATQPSSIGPTISLSESDETDHEEDENANTAGQEPPKKKLRVTAAAVHLEFEQQKDNKGVWNSKCKHCSVKETVYKHKNCSALLCSSTWRENILQFTRNVWKKISRRGKRGEIQ